jgi:hypothetical protein
VAKKQELGKQDELYQQTVATYGAALERLAKAYEADPEKRCDLLQEIHVALWQSFTGSALFIASIFYGIYRLNQRSAKDLQFQIEALKTLQRK